MLFFTVWFHVVSSFLHPVLKQSRNMWNWRLNMKLNDVCTGLFKLLQSFCPNFDVVLWFIETLKHSPFEMMTAISQVNRKSNWKCANKALSTSRNFRTWLLVYLTLSEKQDLEQVMDRKLMYKSSGRLVWMDCVGGERCFFKGIYVSAKRTEISRLKSSIDISRKCCKHLIKHDFEDVF